MPGRQAHGRPLLPTAGSSGGGGPKKSRSKSKPAGFSRSKATAKALDAFAIAAEQIPTSNKGVRTRDLDPEPSERRGAKNKRRHQDNDDEDDEDMDDEDEDEDLDGPPRKKTRPTRDDDDDFGGFSGGSDSEGNEWHTGVAGDDEDSDIDSDEAFGESDEERFEGFAFRGSSSNKKKPKKPKKKQADGSDDDSEEEEEEEEDDEDLESLGSDAIDLATALDQYESDDDQPGGGQDSGSGSEEEDDEDEDSEESESESESDDEDDEDVDDPSKLSALQNIIAGFGGDDEEEKGDGQKKSNKLSLSDLGLAGLVKDPHIKKSLKLMNKEEKADKAGAAKKLDVPLPRRQQEQLLRSAAYEKTSETLDRWIDTVKHNRRADHLVFPLAQNAQNWGLDQTELAPVTQKTAGTELEQTILAIMEESGLGPSAKPEKKEGEEDAVGADGQKLSAAELKEMQRQRRRERELHSREAARAKRIKKIKSKAYRRIHRKELLKEQQAEHDALAEAGELDSDEERETLDRRRALERMGVRHKESKWAKLGKKAGRAVWDDDFRAGLTDITRRKEELRRRIEGRKNADGGSDDDDDDDDDEGSFASGDDGEVDKRRLLKELEKAAAYDDDEPQSALMKMKFMQRGEAQRKKENDDAVKDLHRQLDSDAEELDSAEEAEVGRRQYGMGKLTANNPFAPKKSKGKAAADAEEEEGRSAIANLNAALAGRSEQLVAAASAEPGAGNAWSRSTGEDGGKKNKKAKASSKAVEVVASAGIEMEMARPEPKAEPAKKSQVAVGEQGDNDNDDDADMHLPMAIRDQELLDQAFGGDYVVEEFEKEKAAVQVEDDDREVDETLPGWGSWVGDGVSNKEKKRHTGRFVTKVEGIKKKDRRDFKLKGVIISEKRVKKNDKYLASQLPHPFESQAQYERSLRLPVGPEWVTKETFQDVTKPRVILKQGIITPMSKPMF